MAFEEIEDAERGLTWVTADISPDYDVILASPRNSGNHVFHLAPVVRFLGVPVVRNERIEMELEVLDGPVEVTLALLTSTELGDDWTIESTAMFETVEPGFRYRVSAPIPGDARQRYYRLRLE